MLVTAYFWHKECYGHFTLVGWWVAPSRPMRGQYPGHVIHQSVAYLVTMAVPQSPQRSMAMALFLALPGKSILAEIESSGDRIWIYYLGHGVPTLGVARAQLPVLVPAE